ncbi:MAG: TIGR00304 family membrane protein [Thermoplasmatota archaeon]
MKWILIPLTSFLLGISLIILSVITGGSELALFFIFPVIYGGGIFLLAGVLMIFLSFISFFFFSVGGVGRTGGRHETYGGYGEELEEQRKTKTDYGGVIFIGPIPIIFGKDKSTMKTMMYIGLIIAVILLFIYLLFFLRLT